MPNDPTAPHSSRPEFSTAPDVLIAAFRRHGCAAAFEDEQSKRCDPSLFLLSIGTEYRWMNTDNVQDFLNELSFSIPLLQIRQAEKE